MCACVRSCVRAYVRAFVCAWKSAVSASPNYTITLVPVHPAQRGQVQAQLHPRFPKLRSLCCTRAAQRIGLRPVVTAVLHPTTRGLPGSTRPVVTRLARSTLCRWTWGLALTVNLAVFSRLGVGWVGGTGVCVEERAVRWKRGSVEAAWARWVVGVGWGCVCVCVRARARVR